MRPRANKLFTLVCVPHAGGGASSFHPWQRHLPARVELRVVQLPGREERWREPLVRRLEPACDALAHAIEAEIDGPYAIFGHSMGALVAYELVRTLRRRAQPLPMRLFVSARAAPHAPIVTRAHTLPDDELRATIVHHGGTAHAILEDDAFGAALLRVIRADFELSETYAHAPEAPLDIPLSVYGATLDRLVPPGRLDGWRQHARDFSLRIFEGDHFYVRTQGTSVVHSILQELAADSRAAARSA
ncbi:thioesterase II family protein [Pendulispora albinea]|uniref:Alpha/beta fold hydrolase n=1 Tax=Pendulispora albinea TaxID=2741071 RepID=A0ABZ2M9L1_9BACT